MQKGPTSTHQMKKGPSGDFYDELQAFMMNCKRQVTHKLLGPIGRMEMENGPIGTHDM